MVRMGTKLPRGKHGRDPRHYRRKTVSPTISSSSRECDTECRYCKDANTDNLIKKFTGTDILWVCEPCLKAIEEWASDKDEKEIRNSVPFYVKRSPDRSCE